MIVRIRHELVHEPYNHLQKRRELGVLPVEARNRLVKHADREFVRQIFHDIVFEFTVD